jgi:hypothetical protein
MIQQCFEYWRGSIEFRFDICASKFHKGRLRFVWDPLGTGSGVPDWAANFNRVIDLSQERSFSVKIGMNQPTAFLGGSASLSGSNENHSPTYENTTPVVLGGNANANGVLRCYVLNRLVAPDDNSTPVEINVFVKMCDDAEFAKPRNGFDTLSYVSQSYVSQSETDAAQAPSDIPTTQVEIPVSDIIGENEVDTTDLIHFGESITSMRQCLKRYSYASTRQIVTDRALGLYQYRLQYSDFPASPGEASVTQYGPQKMTLMNFLTPCYAARRGGIRWKYNVINPTNSVDQGILTSNGGELQVYRQSYLTLSASDAPFNSITLATGIGVTDFDVTTLMNNHGTTDVGAYITLADKQNAMEVELPYQTNRRFSVCKLVKVSDGDLGWASAHRVTFMRPSASVTGANFATTINAYCAAGEDFSLSMFLNVPPMYNNLDL